jgi:D-glycero-alpha-D-manno-heptose-7-phosphate kinase
MIISKTPFRVSLAGGGSDLAEYYRHGPGRVVSLAISRYMYVTVNRRFDRSIRVSYTRTEIVDRLDDLQHNLIREALRMTGVTEGVEITTIADLPAGIGLGSSSALTVGLLNALHAFKGEWQTPAELAAKACQIEIEVLGHPIGKQDQYIAAFGGLQEIQFNPDDSVQVRPVICARQTRARLQRHLLLFYTGTHREAGSVLNEARGRMASSAEARANVDRLVAMADSVKKLLIGSRVPRLGPLMAESWRVKKQMATGVTTPALDRLYRRAIRAGADGGKVSGAGGGGCLLLVARPAAHDRIRASMRRAGLRELPVAIEPEGSRIIHYGD